MERQQRAEELAVQILKYARNELLVAFRFLDLALCKPELQAGGLETLGIDGKYLRFNPDYIFELYQQGGGELLLMCLKTVLKNGKDDNHD